MPSISTNGSSHCIPQLETRSTVTPAAINAAAFIAAGVTVERVSSWGMQWLEPLVDIDGIGYGPVSVDQVADIMNGTAPSLGRIAEHPFIANQTRLTFARAGKTRPLSLDDYYASDGWLGQANRPMRNNRPAKADGFCPRARK